MSYISRYMQNLDPKTRGTLSCVWACQTFSFCVIYDLYSANERGQRELSNGAPTSVIDPRFASPGPLQIPHPDLKYQDYGDE